MPGFSTQFVDHDPFEISLDGPFRDWAYRSSASATTMLQAWSAAQLTKWGHALERQLQRVAEARVGQTWHQADEAVQVMTSAEDVRWRLTDLQLLSEIDPNALKSEMLASGDTASVDRTLEAWQLRALLALWKLADAKQVLSRAEPRARSVPDPVALAYAGKNVAPLMAHVAALELAGSLVTEAAVAVTLAWDAYHRHMLASTEAWAKSAKAILRAHAKHAESRRANDLVLAWLKPHPLEFFPSQSAAARVGLMYLKANKFDPPLAKPEFVQKTVFDWMTEAGPEYVRWKRRRLSVHVR